MENMVVSGSDITFGLLGELMTQLNAGVKTGGRKGITGAQFRAFLEHRNPFSRSDIEEVLPFADEEIDSSYGYPPGFRILSVQEQLQTLIERADFFEKNDASHIDQLASRDLPEGAEGWGLFPKPSVVGSAHHNNLIMFLRLLSIQRSFHTWSNHEVTTNHLRISARTLNAIEILETETPGDFLVIPVQFGMRHRGRSMRRTRACFAENEFGLGPYEVAVLMLTHPGRITGHRQLNAGCPGADYAPKGNCAYREGIYFHWGLEFERLRMSFSTPNDMSRQSGPCTGFLMP